MFHCFCLLACLLVYSVNKPFSRDSSHWALYSTLGTKKGVLVLNQEHTDISSVATKWNAVHQWVGVGYLPVPEQATSDAVMGELF